MPTQAYDGLEKFDLGIKSVFDCITLETFLDASDFEDLYNSTISLFVRSNVRKNVQSEICTLREKKKNVESIAAPLRQLRSSSTSTIFRGVNMCFAFGFRLLKIGPAKRVEMISVDKKK